MRRPPRVMTFGIVKAVTGRADVPTVTGSERGDDTVRYARYAKPRSDVENACQHKTGGFTFMELVIVVLILGIITMMAMPAMNDFFADEKINAAADAVVTAVYYARTTAITTGVDHRVYFDVAANSFWIEMYTGGTPPDETFETVRNPATKRDYVVSFSVEETALRGVNVDSAQFGADEYVRFDNLGNPVAIGQVVLNYGGRQRTITVTATSCEISQ